MVSCSVICALTTRNFVSVPLPLSSILYRLNIYNNNMSAERPRLGLYFFGASTVLRFSTCLTIACHVQTTVPEHTLLEHIYQLIAHRSDYNPHPLLWPLDGIFCPHVVNYDMKHGYHDCFILFSFITGSRYFCGHEARKRRVPNCLFALSGNRLQDDRIIRGRIVVYSFGT